MAAAFFLLEHVHLTLELGVRGDGTGLHEHHAALDVFLLDAPQQQTNVVASHALIEQLAEHFHTGDGGLAGVLDADDFDLFADLDDAALDPAGGHGAATGDGEDVFHCHQEGLVHFPLRLRNAGVNSRHQFLDLGFPLSLALDGLQAGDLNHGDVVAGEVVAGEQFADLHLHQFDDLFVIDHVALVECNHQSGNAHLLGQKDVLLGLGHGAVGGGTHQDGAVHLSGTGDHVLHIVRVARAVHVGVVTSLGLVLNVSGVDGDAALTLFRGAVDVGVVLNFSLTLLGEHVGDRSGEGGLAVVNVADGADVDVGLVPFELLACHGCLKNRGLDLEEFRDQELP